MAIWDTSTTIAVVDSTRHEVADLPSGDHVFLVKAIDKEGNRSLNHAEVTVNIPVNAGTQPIQDYLEDSATIIRATSPSFLLFEGLDLAELFIGSSGITATNLGGDTTFSINALNGEAAFGGSLTAATGTFIGSVNVGASIEGGVTIGTSTGTAMIAATTAAQDDATAALANVASHSYLTNILEDAAAQIQTNASAFILVGSLTDGLYLGNTGLYSKVAGVTKFSIDNLGNATFAGALNAATGTFSGNLSAVGGTFTGTLSGVDGTFSGTLSSVGGTFTGTLSGVDGTFSGTLSSTKQISCNTTIDALSTNAAIKGIASFGYGIHGEGITGGVYGKCSGGGSGVIGYSTSAVGSAGTFQNTAGGKALWALGSTVCSDDVDIGGNLDVIGNMSADEITADTKFHKGTGIYETVGTMKVWQIASGTDGNGDWGTYRYTFY